jgi:hypothetical protein
VTDPCPTEQELRRRILVQLNWGTSINTIALLWHGYLAALLECKLLEASVHGRLSSLLPRVGAREKSEMFSREPLTPEHRREVDEFLNRRPRKPVPWLAAQRQSLRRRSHGGRLNRRSPFMENLFELITKFGRIFVMVYRDGVLDCGVQQFLVWVRGYRDAAVHFAGKGAAIYIFTSHDVLL